MVAKIISGKSIRGMLHYNENKVFESKAQLLLASGFAADVTQMSLLQKLQRFQHLTMLTGNIKTNAIHISLNFDSQDKLRDLGKGYAAKAITLLLDHIRKRKRRNEGSKTISSNHYKV